MYEAFFRLHKRPFSATPDASCFFASDPAAAALADLTRCVVGGQGIGILTAPAGIGKTLLCRRLQQDLSERFRTAFLGTGDFVDRRALLQAILYELDRPYSGMEDQELRLELATVARACRQTSEGLLIIIDEAHLLGMRLLEEIRYIADLSRDGNPLVRIVLSGQLELEETLTSPALEAFNQRIAAHVSLEPLTRKQTVLYIAHRIAWAGGNASTTFSGEALDLIAKACEGVPRCINQICDHSLLLAYVSHLPKVEAQIVMDALGDLKQLPLHVNPAAAVITDHPVPSSNGDAGSKAPTREEPMDTDEGQGEETLDLQPISGGASIEIGADLDDGPSSAEESEYAVEQPTWEERACLSSRDTFSADIEEEESTVLFEEEAVEDLYAALDAGLPADQVAGQPQTPFGGDNSFVRGELREDPVTREQEILRNQTPDRTLDLVLPLIEQAQETAETSPAEEAAERDTVSAALAAEIAEETDSLEDRIGAAVLDVCLEAQQSIAAMNDSGRSFVPLDDRQVPTLKHQSKGVTRVTRFDIVQPEGNDSTAGDAPRKAPDGPSGAVPRPNYKLVFSMLRKRQKKQS